MQRDHSLGYNCVRSCVLAFSLVSFCFSLPVLAKDNALPTQNLRADFSIPQSITSMLRPGESGLVDRVIDGDSLVLTSGLRVSISGVQAPKMAWPDRGLTAWPLAQSSKTFLEKICLGRTAQLYYGGDERDRHGRATAQVECSGVTEPSSDPGVIWAQQAVLRAGMGRLYPWRSMMLDVGDLYQAQAQARMQQTGIWNAKDGRGFYDIRPAIPKQLSPYIASVQMVRGQVRKAANVKGRIYLNFGDNYKTDFTIAIDKKLAKKMSKQGNDPMRFEGELVEIIGWVEDQNGPMIWLSDPRRLKKVSKDQ